MSIDFANAFKKIAEAQATVGGNYINDGDYTHIIDKVFVEQKEKGLCFIVELFNEASSAQPGRGEPDPPGKKVSFVQVLDRFKSAPGNAKAFMLAATNQTEAQLLQKDAAANKPAGTAAQEELARICNPESSPLRGVRVKNSTRRQWTRDKSKELVLSNFSPVPNQTPETIADGVAKLEGRVPLAKASSGGSLLAGAAK